MSKCNILDITKIDASKINNETFGIDTNVLYWMHYSKGSYANNYQTSTYPKFLSDLIVAGNKLYTTMYNISELLYIIERNEYKQYKNNNNCNISKKKYRGIANQRESLKKEYLSVLNQVESIYSIHDFEINIVGVKNFTAELSNHMCDNFDYQIIDELKKQGISNFITDDSDFKSIDDINLYTANSRIK
ncbi:MAG: hypothetical protein N4A76_10460 [Firmicutes bacterium]|jgi:predicted nucleic acid-binding protein|nr:hypothetical protein [Bacillota bacterium]